MVRKAKTNLKQMEPLLPRPLNVLSIGSMARLLKIQSEEISHAMLAFIKLLIIYARRLSGIFSLLQNVSNVTQSLLGD